MLSKDSNLRTTVIGTVVGGLILAAVLALVPKALAGVVWASKLIYGFLWFQLKIPTWVILFILLITVLLLRILARVWLHSTPVGTSSEASPEPLPAPDPFSKLELSIISTLVRGDGKYLSRSEIAQSIRSSVLLTEQAMDSLDRRNMLMTTGHYMGYTIYRLSPQGRDYAIENGLAGI